MDLIIVSFVIHRFISHWNLLCHKRVSMVATATFACIEISGPVLFLVSVVLPIFELSFNLRYPAKIAPPLNSKRYCLWCSSGFQQYLIGICLFPLDCDCRTGRKLNWLWFPLKLAVISSEISFFQLPTQCLTRKYMLNMKSTKNRPKKSAIFVLPIGVVVYV
jgi:hypothetical protein